jgi:hypothetical protein
MNEILYLVCETIDLGERPLKGFFDKKIATAYLDLYVLKIFEAQWNAGHSVIGPEEGRNVIESASLEGLLSIPSTDIVQVRDTLLEKLRVADVEYTPIARSFLNGEIMVNIIHHWYSIELDEMPVENTVGSNHD